MSVVPAPEQPGGVDAAASGSAEQQSEVIDQLLHEPIAIVGVGLRFPGSNTTLDEFEEFLREGRNGIRPVPPDRWDVERFRPTGEPDERGVVVSAGCGFLDNIDEADAPFFSMSPLEAQYTDPQQRLLLECAWEALESASINPATLRHGNGGVYIGASSIDYALEMEAIRYEDLDGHLAAGVSFFPMSGRLSYVLGWHGPSFTTDTACASGLTALHLAVQGLRRGECDIALAGGVNAIHHPRILVMFSHGNMMAPDGQCKTFDESADGYVRAEGCGMLVLKRLSDAQRDDDHILGIVTGTAIGQDGESAGLTVPNGTAQTMIMRQAMENANVRPEEIQYVEAHGTGTALGDPIEMGAISDVFAKSHTKERPVTVASLKTNIGHMEPVAGIGSIIKILLQMRTSTIFPHLNMKNPSGRIPWDTIPVSVPLERRPWDAPVKRALVNSFGFAGGIACAVIEQAPPQAERPALPDDGAHVFTLSAKTKRSLQMLIERYQEHLAAHPDVSIADLCYTANVGRSHFALRIAVPVSDREQLSTALDKQLAQLDKGGRRAADLRKVAFLFTGQGSQYAGMGAPLYHRYPLFRELVDECDRLFQPLLDRSVKAMLLGELDDQEEINQTRFTQPALFTLEYALAKLWMSWGVRPNVLIGHSIGEVVAAAVAGLFTLEDAVTLVAARARLMQSVTAPGGMLAVNASADEVAPLIKGYDDTAIAGINSPKQCVVSGGKDSLAAITEALKERGFEPKPLVVSHAFHSPLMTEVFDEFREAIAGVQYHEPSLTIVSNVTGKVARPSEISNPDYWVRHIGEPVNFEAGMRTVDRRGKHAFVEVGPSAALTGLAKQCVEADEHRWVSSLHKKDTDGMVLLDAVAQLYVAGIPLSWTGFHAGRERRKVDLPLYAFDRKRYWMPVKGKRHGLGQAVVQGDVHHPLLGREVTTDEQRAAGVREFSAQISATNPAYLADHVVMGRVVFPGTGYLEAIMALQDAVHGDTRRPVEAVTIREPLFLAEEEATDLRTRLRTGDGGRPTVELVSRIEGPTGVIERTHLTAELGDPAGGELRPEGKALLEMAASAGDPDGSVSEDDVYAAYSQAGLQYGPEFHRMGSVQRWGERLAVGELRSVPAGALEQVPPFIVDAAGHAFAAIGEDGDSYLPVGYKSYRVFKKPKADRLRVLLTFQRVQEPGIDLSVDYVVLEGDRPVLEMIGLGCKRVADDSGRRSLVHELRWVKRALVGQVSDDAHRILALHHSEAQGARLVEQAAVTPHEVRLAGSVDEAAAMLRDEAITDVVWFWQPGEGQVTAESLHAESERNYRELLELLPVLDREQFGRNQRLWLVTERTQLLPREQAPERPPTGASLWGFGHVLLNEHPSYRATMVDLSGDDGDYRRLLDECQASSSGDFQVAYRDGLRHVRRLLPINPRAKKDRGNFGLAIKEFGQFSGLRVVPMDDVAPQGDEIQVQVDAAGLNFKDVLNALGMLKDFGDQPLGFEAAGTVVAVGPDATHQVGDEVIVNYLGCMKRRVNVPSAVAVEKPANVSVTEAAGLMAVYVTAYYALHTLAGMKAGDKVLIHAAAGGVGQAAVQLAKAAGAEVYATASPHKWPLLRAQGVEHVMSSRTLEFADQIQEMTGGRGVDIVLNSLNKDYIPAGMQSLAENGRFIEMGKVGAWTPEQVREVRPDVTYHNFDLSELPWDDAVRVTSQIMRIIADQVADGTLPPVRTTVYSLDEIEEAFGILSRGANIGKLVLDFADERKPAPPVTISPDRTYLVTGGLGALGLVTAEKLADLGAKHIALVSRGTTPAPDAAHIAERLRQKAEVTHYQGDIASKADVDRIMAAIKESPYPLGGIIHSAGLIADAPISAHTWETMESVFAPKVLGTWLLHEAAASAPELELFVGYSSAAPVVGTLAQANYAAANAFMDNLLLWRAAQGRPGLSINWGPWGEVGMSARLSEPLLKRWADEGITLTTPAVGMRALTSLLGKPYPQAVVGACEWDRFVANKPVVNALYQKLVSSGSADAASTIDLGALIAAPRRERKAAIDEFVRGKVADVLHFDDPEAVDSTTEFIRLGLDSLVAVELKNALEAAFRVPLPASVALDYPSAEALSEFLDQQLVPEPAS
ncbi:MAG: SDR family NAD(P)-dependent oxidoreductase [Frankiaceae bacterium]